MGGKSSSTTVGYRYYMSLLMGLCRGPIDEIVQIEVGSLRAWPVPDGASVGMTQREPSTGDYHSENYYWETSQISLKIVWNGTVIQDSQTVLIGSNVTEPRLINGYTYYPGEIYSEASGTTIRGVYRSNIIEVMNIAEGPSQTGIAQYEDGTFVITDVANVNTVRDSGVVQINAPELFGGDKKEGGIQGPLRSMFGYSTQVVPAYIKTLITGNVPDMRGVVTLFFDGLLTSLNPYPKTWRFRVRRTTNGWDGEVWQPDLVTIWMRDGMIKAMNPAHILYECLTNRDWGRGYSRSWIYDEQWTSVAQKLHDEGLGLCLYWNRKQDLSGFVGNVIDHIGGSLYVDRTRGLISLSLLRGDYDMNDIPLFTYDTGLLNVEDPETASQGDIINEVVVKWYDPIIGKSREGRVQNVASIMSNGGAVNSQSADYGGTPTIDLALRLAQRDVKANANSLKRFKVILDRRAWKIIPGSLFRINAPKHDIYNLVLRAGKISEGALPDGKITVEAVMDVFSLPSASFAAAETGTWLPPSRAPVIAANRVFREANYTELVRSIDPANLALIEPDVGAIAAIVAKPSSMSQGFNLATGADGESIVSRSAGPFSPFAITSDSVSVYTTEVAIDGGVDLGLVETDSAMQIGDEICRLDSITLNADRISGVITISRGCADTLPRTHPIGTPIYFYDSTGTSDGREYAVGEEVSAQVLTYTSSATLSETLAPVDTITITGRQGRPIAPGNLKVNGVPFGSLGTVSGGLVFTWAHRSRLLAQDKLIPHASGSMGPEPGTTYTLRLSKTDGGAADITVTGITDTTTTVTAVELAAAGFTNTIWVELEAVRDSLASFDKYHFSINLA